MKTKERTIERPRVERPQAVEHRKMTLITPMAAAAALLVGVLAGFLLWGTDSRDPLDPVAVGGESLTPRQEQMVDLVDDYLAAWQTGDGEAAAAMFTEDGVLIAFGNDRPANDGSLASYVSSRPTPSLEILDPALVSESGMFSYYTYAGVGTLKNVIEFTPDGEVLLVSHEIRE